MDWSRFKPRLPKIRFSVLLLEKLIIGSFYVAVVLAVTGTVGYFYYQPYLKTLQIKDRHRYEEAIEEFKELHFIEAYRRLKVLEALDMNELYQERYKRWQNRYRKDRQFRAEQERERKNVMEKAREARLERHKKSYKDIEYTNRLSGPLAERLRWGQATPWEKGLILREKCVHYLQRQQQEWLDPANPEYQSGLPQTFQDIHLAGHTPGVFCTELIPLGDDPAAISRAFDNMKDKLGYFQYLQLLGEIGVKENEVFSFHEKLEKMTGDLAGT